MTLFVKREERDFKNRVAILQAHNPTACFQARSGSTQFQAVSWNEGRSSEDV